MEWAIAKKKPYFQGKRATEVINARQANRKLVGFTLPNESPIPKECNLVIDNTEIIGRVTSISQSPSLNKIIGLAFVSSEKSNPEQTIQIKLSNGKMIEAQVCQTPFYDPDNKRQEL